MDEKLIEYLESRLKENPHSLLFARLADLYIENGEIDKAITLCNEGIKDHPSYSTGYFILAKAYIQKKEYDKAESALKNALSYDQQYLSAHKLLGDMLLKAGWENLALDHYNAILEIDPFEEKVKEIVKKIAPSPTEKTPLLEKEEEPISELPLEEIAPEPPLEESSSEPLAPEPELDWMDQIREFSPLEESPIPPPESPATSNEFPSQPLPFQEEKTSELLFSEPQSPFFQPELSPLPPPPTPPETPEELIVPMEEEKPILEEQPMEISPPEEMVESSQEPIIVPPEAPRSEPPQVTPSQETEQSTPFPPPPPPPEPEKISKIPKAFVTPTLGEIYIAQGQYEKAIQIYQALLEKNPNEKRYKEKIEEIQRKLREASGR